jgi:S-formylglutathione hydrolase FrmB
MGGDQATVVVGRAPGWSGRALAGALVAVLTVVLVLVPSGARAATREAAPSTIETFELPSPLVDTSTPGGALEDGRSVPKVHVVLPDGYADHPDRRYPVLWLLHGAAGGTDTWLPGITTLLPHFPGIIVMPDGGRFGMYTDWWNGGARGGPAWATYHLEVLRRTIEDRYRIRAGRRWHAIAGISMGGQGALRYAAMLPGYFGSVAGFSAALPDMQSLEAQYGLGLLAAVNQAGGATYEEIFGPASGPYAEGNNPMALAANLGHTRVYLTSGWGIGCPQDPINPASIAIDTVTETFLHAEQVPFAKATRAAGAHVTAVTTCGVHTFGVWDRAIPAARDWGFFNEVPDQPDRWTYRTIATAGEMWGLRFRFTAPPSAVVDFARAGTQLSGAGSGEVQISGPPGCEFRATLPFVQPLPAACLVHP